MQVVAEVDVPQQANLGASDTQVYRLLALEGLQDPGNLVRAFLHQARSSAQLLTQHFQSSYHNLFETVTDAAHLCNVVMATPVCHMAKRRSERNSERKHANISTHLSVSC